MRRTVDVLGWGLVLITTLALILTILTTYQFVYIKYFYGYYTLQWCIFFTMVVWSIKLIDFKGGLTNKIYPLICIFFAAGSIFFIFMNVQ